MEKKPLRTCSIDADVQRNMRGRRVARLEDAADSEKWISVDSADVPRLIEWLQDNFPQDGDATVRKAVEEALDDFKDAAWHEKNQT